LRVVARDVDDVLAGHTLRLHHHQVIHGVECLHDLCVRQRTLDLLTERVGVAHRQEGRHAPGKIERIGYIDEDLATQSIAARKLERGQRAGSRSAVEDDVGCCSGVRERALRAAPTSGAHPLNRFLAVARPRSHDHVVAERDQLAPDRPADHPRAKDCNVHVR
jgi:hypothetical protein